MASGSHIYEVEIPIDGRAPVQPPFDARNDLPNRGNRHPGRRNSFQVEGSPGGGVSPQGLPRDNAPWHTWLKDLHTELYQILYEKPIYPKNLYLKREPMKHNEYRQKVIKRQIRLMHDRGIWKKPER